MEQPSALLELYERIEQDKSTNAEYNRIRRKSIELRDIINKRLEQDQREQLDQLMTYKNDMANEECKDYFIEGFSLATRLMIEVFYKEDQ